jgi:ADP-heptose:LPS heptosyltransferase
MKNILVTRTDRLGDVILSLPVAAAIKAATTGTNVTFLVAEQVAPVVSLCPWVDDCLTIAKAQDPSSIVATLRERAFDAAICLYPRPYVASRLKQAGIPVRIGTSRRWYSYRFTRRVNLSRASSGRHERDLNLELLRGLGWGKFTISDPLCIPTQDSQRAARILLDKAGFDWKQHPYAVVHPGCGGSARNWKPERYRQLCQTLKENGLAVLVTGLNSEKQLAADVVGETKDGIASLAGTTDLTTLAALLQQASVFVGPSTGPMHLAAAVGTPVVALFGPVRTTGPDRWGPLGTGHQVFVPPVDTCDCRVDHCRLGDCMDMIDVQSVAGAVVRAAASDKRVGQPRGSVEKAPGQECPGHQT